MFCAYDVQDSIPSPVDHVTTVHRTRCSFSLPRSLSLSLFQNIVIEGGRSGGRVFLVDFGGVQEAVTDKPSSTIVGTYGYGYPSCFLRELIPVYPQINLRSCSVLE